MTCYNKSELENLLEDVVNELDLSSAAMEYHGQHGTTPSKLVRLVLDEKDRIIRYLSNGMLEIKNKKIQEV